MEIWPFEYEFEITFLANFDFFFGGGGGGGGIKFANKLLVDMISKFCLLFRN